MNTRFPVVSAHRPLFTGSPSAKPATSYAQQGSSVSGVAKTDADTLELRQDAQEEKPRPGFVTPSTPSTIKTDTYTTTVVEGAQNRLDKLLSDGTITETDHATFSNALEQSEQTSDTYKDKARVLYSKLYEADDDIKELRRSTNRTIGLLMQENKSAHKKIEKLNQQVQTLSPQVESQSPVKPHTVPKIQEAAPSVTPRSPMLRKQPFERPKSSLRNSLTVTEEAAASNTVATEKTPQAGNIKSSDRQL